MARNVKVFEVEVEEKPEGIPFVIRVTDKDGKTQDHDFEAVSELSAGAQLSLGAVIHTDRFGKRSIDLGGFSTFMQHLLPYGDFERLQTLLDDPELFIRIETLMDIFTYLTETLTGRPTKPSPGSSNGRRSTKASSKAGQLTAVSTSET